MRRNWSSPTGREGEVFSRGRGLIVVSSYVVCIVNARFFILLPLASWHCHMFVFFFFNLESRVLSL